MGGDRRPSGKDSTIYALRRLSSALLPVRHIRRETMSGARSGGLCRIPAMHCHTASFSPDGPTSRWEKAGTNLVLGISNLNFRFRNELGAWSIKPSVAIL